TEKTVVKMWFDYGYPIICVALLIALAMLFYFKTLRCLRNYIHCNLMLAMLISNTNYILFSYFGMNFARQNPDGCKAVGLYLIYFNTAINFWMFVEGFYLLTVVLWTYRAHKIRLWYFLLFGWGTPLVVTSIYAVLMALYDTENLCWLPRNMKASELTIYSIFVISLSILLSINFFIVIYVVWTLCHKLRGNTTVEIQQVRKATRAIIVLLPILGVHFLVTYLFEFVSPALEIYLFYITNGLQASQGIMVPLLYCFLNGEVHTAIRQKWAVFQEHRSLKASLSHNLSGKKSGHSGIRSSFDNKDISPTLNDKTEIAQLSMTPTGMRQTPLAKIESSV
ncbi:corticotropin-releasing factor receptor 2, partial [Biomphalaria pfeifferi]